MIDAGIRKFCEMAGAQAAETVLPQAAGSQVLERERLAFRLAVAFAAAMVGEQQKLHREEAA